MQFRRSVLWSRLLVVAQRRFKERRRAAEPSLSLRDAAVSAATCTANNDGYIDATDTTGTDTLSYDEAKELGLEAEREMVDADIRQRKFAGAIDIVAGAMQREGGGADDDDDSGSSDADDKQDHNRANSGNASRASASTNTREEDERRGTAGLPPALQY